MSLASVSFVPFPLYSPTADDGRPLGGAVGHHFLLQVAAAVSAFTCTKRLSHLDLAEADGDGSSTGETFDHRERDEVQEEPCRRRDTVTGCVWLTRGRHPCGGGVGWGGFPALTSAVICPVSSSQNTATRCVAV